MSLRSPWREDNDNESRAENHRLIAIILFCYRRSVALLGDETTVDAHSMRLCDYWGMIIV